MAQAQGTNNDVVVVRSKETQIKPKFLYYILSDDNFFKYEMQNVKGVKMPRGDKDSILNYIFSLPPLEAQEKIISAIDSVESKIATIDSKLSMLVTREREQAEIKEILSEIESLLSQRKILQRFITTILQKAGFTQSLHSLLDSLPTPPPQGYPQYRLNDKNKFSLQIGKRVLDSELNPQGQFPVFSANVKKPFGFIDKELLKDYEKDSVLWGIDGDWMVGFIPKNTPFYPIDHCGVLQVNDKDIKAKIVSFLLDEAGKKAGFRRNLRASIERIGSVKIPLPPIEAQKSSMLLKI
ncbi:restriction endonuclease subunit S [Campylobacter upsaliensis]|uniref:restriction endonuclease subunit S n=1 Tax=Campylobacter upsaliensis TaxID=28080 RepID=UPI002B3E0B9F|nr:restriction endonuclease subunit S [Campylobacter upsaliensis]MEB2808310.1 restriction endonuclease subunit S [Campylobacter upsaliensis]